MKKPWSLQQIHKGQDIPSFHEVVDIINSIKSPRSKALVAICYLTAGRISEVVKCDALVKYVFEYEQIKPKVIKRIEGKAIYQKERTEINYKGICKKDIWQENIKGREFIVFALQNRKHRKLKRKNIPVLYDKYTAQLMPFIYDYTSGLKDDEPLFDFQRSRAYQLIRKATGFNPHFFRDIRLTHLVLIYDFREYQLIKYAGWTDGRSASEYVRLSYRDVWG